MASSGSPARGRPNERARVPSDASMSELTDLSAAQAAAEIRAGEISARELFDAYRERAAADELNAYTWVAEASPAEMPGADRPLAGVPLAVKDLFCTEGIPSQSGSRILGGYR